MTLEILTSDLLAEARHGFFTRKGGASSGIFAGLNCGTGSSDQREAVALNRARVAGAMQVPPDRLISLHQVHSAEVVTVDATGWPERPRADAAVTDRPGIALGILTADCAPVLLSDPQSGVIGAAHAGWRGALGGLLEAVVAAMTRLGARRERIQAAVGPAISRPNYEVGPEFVSRFRAEKPAFEQFFSACEEGRYHFDLPGFVVERLAETGATAGWTGQCTYADPARFYSYRRTTHAGEPDYGRLISVIRL